VPTRSESDLEDAFFALCARCGVPMPERNVPIGRFRVDFLWRHERLIAEVDSYRYHRGRQAFRDDRERDADLAIWGFRVVRFDDMRIDTDSAGVASDVLALLARHSP